ncbi:MAG: DUF2207 domain-containing protein [Fimbriimonadaceae bacterium]|nr:DUF2207 domain-containing protein [Fimbriimonadaceae bacterium]
MRVACLLVALSLAALSLGAKFETESFHSSYQLLRDRTVEIEETISVRFLERQHGLLRNIPFRTQGGGRVREVRYDLLSTELKRGGSWAPVPAQQSNQGGDWALRIGDANRWESGRVSYRIRYRVQGALTRFETDANIGPHDELFWNVLPTDWPTSIRQATVDVGFPKVEGSVRARVLVGARGSRDGGELERGGKFVGNAPLVDLSYPSPTTLRVRIKRTLQPHEGATLVLGLPLEAFEAPPPPSSHPEGQGGDTSDPAGFIPTPDPLPYERLPSNPLGFVIPLIPAGLFWWLYKDHFKRNPGPLVVRYEAPEGVGPIEAGYLMDGKVDPGDIVGAIVGLAQKGAGRLIHADEGIQFEVGSLEGAKNLTPSDRRLFEALEPFGPIVTADLLEGAFAESYRDLNNGAGREMAARGWARANRTEGCGCIVLCLVLFVAASAGFLFAGLPVLLGLAAAVVVGFIAVVRTDLLTPEGAKVRHALRGLEEFIARAHKKELNYLVDRVPDQALFEELLPFAIAFGLVDVWTRAFDGIGLRQPGWYVGPYDGYWTATLMSDLTTFQDTWSSAIAPVTSYGSGSGFSSGDSGFGGGWSGGGGGFSGGGSSGGGGGGGGGGSW